MEDVKKMNNEKSFTTRCGNETITNTIIAESNKITAFLDTKPKNQQTNREI